MSVYNSNGKKVAQLPGGKITWIPEKKLSSGLYLVKAELGNQVVTTQVIFMK
ncbi:MAG: T9SS type A sorting domain-containing protein [bacterium]